MGERWAEHGHDQVDQARRHADGAAAGGVPGKHSLVEMLYGALQTFLPLPELDLGGSEPEAAGDAAVHRESLTEFAGALRGAATEAKTDAKKPEAKKPDKGKGKGKGKGKDRYVEPGKYHGGWDLGGAARVADSGDEAGAAIQAVSAVEGGYDSVQTYDRGVLSFGILQWTLHAGSLQGFLGFLKEGSGPDGTAAFNELFVANGIDVKRHGRHYVLTMLGIEYPEGEKLEALVRTTPETARAWAEIFQRAGADPRVQRAQFTKAKQQYTAAQSGNLEKHVDWTLKHCPKTFFANHRGHYGNASEWSAASPRVRTLLFSMKVNNPGYGSAALLKAIDWFLDKVGVDRAAWPAGWQQTFTGLFEESCRGTLDNWAGRVDKTLRNWKEDDEATPAPAPAPAIVDGPDPAPAPAPAPAPEAPKPKAKAKPKADSHADDPQLTSADLKLHYPDDRMNVFAKAVYDLQVERKLGRGKRYYHGTSDLELVESGQKMRPDAAAKCKELLAAARAVCDPFHGLPADQRRAAFEATPRDELALTESIGCASGYRDPADDMDNWKGAFNKHFVLPMPPKDKNPKMHEVRAKLDKLSDRFSAEAVSIAAGYLANIKTPAGFSNHTTGVAMDFKTTVWRSVKGKLKPVGLGANTNEIAEWKTTWLYHWLHENHARFGFEPLGSEPWHWDYHPKA